MKDWVVSGSQTSSHFVSRVTGKLLDCIVDRAVDRRATSVLPWSSLEPRERHRVQTKVGEEMDEVAQLKKEIARLKEVVKELTAALKVLSDKDDRAKNFIERVEQLLSDAEEAKDDAITERDEAVIALSEEKHKN